MSTAEIGTVKTDLGYVNIGLDTEEGEALSEVYIDPEENVRNAEDTDPEFESFVESIKASAGLLQPIILHRDEDNPIHDKTYKLVGGFRRVRALRHLADGDPESHWVTKVPATIKDAATTELQKEVDQAIENFQRHNLCPLEQGKQVVKLRKLGLKGVQIAKILGLARNTVSEIITTMQLDPRILELTLPGMANDEDDPDRPMISWSVAKEIGAANKKSGGLTFEEQDDLVQTSKKMPIAEFQKRTRSLFDEPSESEDEDEAAEGTEEQGKQKRGLNAKPSRVIKDRYLPHIKEDLEKVEDQEQKIRLAHWKECMEWILNNEGTALEDYFAPWEEELQKKEEQEKSAKTSKGEATKWANAMCKFIAQSANKYASNPDPEQQVKGTVSYCLQQIKKKAQESMDKLKKEQGEDYIENQMSEGFNLGYSPDEIPEKFILVYKQWFKDKEDRIAKMQAARAKKKAEEDAKEKAEKENKPAEESKTEGSE